MNHDEFAFFNQQLASMLREGIPLEGALKQLCASMKTSPLRAELQTLEADLAKGTPLPEAVSRRNLPELYKRMVLVGVRGNDLPGVLTLVADHHQRVNAIWTRLKGLMVYPLLVVFIALALTILLSLTLSRFLAEFFHQSGFGAPPASAVLSLSVWVPPVLLALIALALVVAVSFSGLRSKLRWRLPAFREASLAQLASAIALMLKNGTPLPEALALAQALESTTPAARPLAQWQQCLAAGAGKPTQWPTTLHPLPPLFLWLVQQGGENLSEGFRKAAEVYQARASYRTDLLLYGALPVSILLLGLMVFWQIAPMMRSMTWLMNMIGSSWE